MSDKRLKVGGKRVKQDLIREASHRSPTMVTKITFMWSSVIRMSATGRQRAQSVKLRRILPNQNPQSGALNKMSIVLNKESTMLKCFCLLWVFFLSCHAVAQHGIFRNTESQYPTYVYLCDRSICAWNAGSKTSRIVSESAGMYLAVSSQGTVAFVQITDEREGRGNPATRLVLMSIDGKIVNSIEPGQTIRSIAWKPDGAMIGFCTGEYQEELEKTPDAYEKAQTFAFDLSKGTTVKLFNGGTRLHWAAFDGNLYIYDQRIKPAVHSYDPDSEIIKPTEFKDITFSPDGRYYYSPHSESDAGFDLYCTARNAPLTSDTNAGLSKTVLKRMVPDRWFQDAWLKCFIYNGQPSQYLLNVGTAEMRQAGGIVSPYTDSTVLMATATGGFEVVEIASLPLVKPEDLPSSR